MYATNSTRQGYPTPGWTKDDRRGMAHRIYNVPDNSKLRTPYRTTTGGYSNRCIREGATLRKKMEIETPQAITTKSRFRRYSGQSNIVSTQIGRT